MNAKVRATQDGGGELMDATRMRNLRAPFPYFGGKSRVAPLVWSRLGDVRNYVEPFAGSLAVLLGRPTAPKIETVNDLDCLIANFWRALNSDPEKLAYYADWPVNEADLRARHLWLVEQTGARSAFREHMKRDPFYFDVNIAGWWVWGICQWIGSGWCAERGGEKRMRLGNDAGRGVLSVADQIPDLGGDSGSAGRGVHASGLADKLAAIGGRPWGMNREVAVTDNGGLYAWFEFLANRLRRVRVCCGDWTRILGPAPTTCIGTTGVFLDPPYAVDDRAEVYNYDSRDVAHAVREWAVANGDNPELRIVLCGYDGEHTMPRRWSEVRWKAHGGFANPKAPGTRGKGKRAPRAHVVLAVVPQSADTVRRFGRIGRVQFP